MFVIMENKSHDIVKSNALIEAVYNPGSVYQMRLLIAALMQVKAKDKLDYRKRYYVSANTLADMTGTKAYENYKELKKAADDLMNTTVLVADTPDGKALPNPIRINLVSSCEYIKGQGTVGLRFTEEITPYVSDVRSRFAQYQAKYVMPMKSSYGIRLYELCLQWLGYEREFSVDDFRQMFGLSGKSFERIEVIKRRVIKPALDDINTHSDIRVDLGQRKAGRKVTHFQFRITRKTPRSDKMTVQKFVSAYPEKTIGKSEVEVKKMIDEFNKNYDLPLGDGVGRPEAAQPYD